MSKEVVNAESNLNGTRARKSPVPANADRITEGALNLKLKERVQLRDKLSLSIDVELRKMREELASAEGLLTGSK